MKSENRIFLDNLNVILLKRHCIIFRKVYSKTLDFRANLLSLVKCFKKNKIICLNFFFNFKSYFDLFLTIYCNTEMLHQKFFIKENNRSLIRSFNLTKKKLTTIEIFYKLRKINKFFIRVIQFSYFIKI
ncbi:hypothetical protein BpHYR1_028703 [Brachionus plicatilis]|uniref:Uncharacterized protein n=1 Tax=Brachionus plicatilis TaxID=10195 RepID=A0A3M7R0Z8_BRAPC|nr:hypothetical protein BpHYR1_028703 [Brachionus plicatilis]